MCYIGAKTATSCYVKTAIPSYKYEAKKATWSKLATVVVVPL